MAKALAVKTRNTASVTAKIGDGVHGEDDVGDLDENQDGEQRGGQQDAFPADQEALAVEVVRHGHVPSEQFQGPGLLRVQHVVAVADHPVAGDEEECGKNVQHPLSAGDDGGAGSIGYPPGRSGSAVLTT